MCFYLMFCEASVELMEIQPIVTMFQGASEQGLNPINIFQL